MKKTGVGLINSHFSVSVEGKQTCKHSGSLTGKKEPIYYGRDLISCIIREK